MKRSVFALLGLLAISFSTGCCGWWWPCGYRGYGPAYGVPQGGACPGGNCGVAPGQQYVPPQTSYYHSYDSVQSVQSGVPAPEMVDGPVTYAPMGYPTLAVPRTAAAPLDSLPTY